MEASCPTLLLRWPIGSAFQMSFSCCIITREQHPYTKNNNRPDKDGSVTAEYSMLTGSPDQPHRAWSQSSPCPSNLLTSASPSIRPITCQSTTSTKHKPKPKHTPKYELDPKDSKLPSLRSLHPHVKLTPAYDGPSNTPPPMHSETIR